MCFQDAKGMGCRSLLKVVVVGNIHSGKTCVLSGMMNKPPRHEATVGCELHTMDVTSPSGCMTSLHIWDLSGADRFRLLTKMYARSSVIIMFVADACDGPVAISEQYADWVESLTSVNATYTYMIINKIDQLEDDALQTLKDIYPHAYYTSAATGSGLQDLCQDLQSRSMQLHRCNISIWNSSPSSRSAICY